MSKVDELISSLVFKITDDNGKQQIMASVDFDGDLDISHTVPKAFVPSFIEWLKALYL